eukprot:CAMPEP_0197624380 /NCGR_PEP_ID=MMETSP1338-20131121/4041_1 /TAXON_ID=43686 ORGANISM="Pelagodinium beii, Strain RCC1491" /NCGR_SAMPLE_ID=MMETSP1338 /ASSEMBLY_ACC=CAM_ASM_000754 /LENGTH=50 /DNA_ID=CAMNT_0043194509 /DNA_START=887 /DNA_END=1039 /DNA_ORIENTATION=+
MCCFKLRPRRLSSRAAATVAASGVRLEAVLDKGASIWAWQGISVGGTTEA